MPNDDYIKRSDALALIVGGNKLISKAWLMNALATTPAADVEPARHGRWVNDSDNIPHCSECEAIALQRHKLYLSERIFEVPFVLSKRCPECGAKMDAEPPKEEDNDNH